MINQNCWLTAALVIIACSSCLITAAEKKDDAVEYAAEAKAVDRNKAMAMAQKTLSTAAALRKEAQAIAMKEDMPAATKLVDQAMDKIMAAIDLLAQTKPDPSVARLQKNLNNLGRKVNFDRYQYRKRTTMAHHQPAAQPPAKTPLTPSKTPKTFDAKHMFVFDQQRHSLRHKLLQSMTALKGKPQVYLTFDQSAVQGASVRVRNVSSETQTLSAYGLSKPQLGQIGGALRVQEGGHLKIGRNHLTDQGTILFWFRPHKGHRYSKKTQTQTLFSCYRNKNSKATIELYKKGYLSAGIKQQGKWLVKFKSAQRAWADKWYFVALVFGPEGARFYVNQNQRYATERVATMQHLQGVETLVGKLRRDNEYAFTGGVDEFALWNRALSPGEISTYMKTSARGRGYFQAQMQELEVNHVAADLLILASRYFKGLQGETAKDLFYIGNKMDEARASLVLADNMPQLFLYVTMPGKDKPGYVYLRQAGDQPEGFVTQNPLYQDLHTYFHRPGTPSPRHKNCYRWELQVDTVAWPEAVKMIQNGEIARVAQYHSLATILVTTKGQQLKTKLPKADSAKLLIEEVDPIGRKITYKLNTENRSYTRTENVDRGKT